MPTRHVIIDLAEIAARDHTTLVNAVLEQVEPGASSHARRITHVTDDDGITTTSHYHHRLDLLIDVITDPELTA